MNRFNTLQNFIVRIMTVMVMTLLTTGCISISRSHKKEESKTTVTPTTIVNLRTGPGTDYKVIKGVYPGTNLTVSGNLDSEWIEVTTEDGTRAYVASKFVKVVSAGSTSAANADNQSPTANAETPSSTPADTSTRYSTPVRPNMDIDDSFLSSYMSFMTSGVGYVVTIIFFLIEGLILWYFHREYDYTFRCNYLKPVAPGIIAVVVSLCLTLFQTIAIFSVRDGAGSLDPYFILMLLSTGLVMAVVPWRLRISGIAPHEQPLYSSSNRDEWGSKLGNWTWTILLIPISILMIQYAGYGDHRIFSNGSLWSMIFDMILFTAGAWLFCAVIWPYVIVKYLLTSINSTVLSLFNFVIIFSIARYEYYACDESFFGVNYVVSLYLLIFSVMVYGALMYKTINEKRCGKCHSFDGQYTHTTDLGYSDHTSREWKSSDTSNITPRHRDAVISDSQRLVSTTKRTSMWKTHHQCPYCDHTWEIENQSTETIDSHTVKRTWKETY